jgi:hypothetical protein
MLDFSPYSVRRARSKGVPATSDLADIDMQLQQTNAQNQSHSDTEDEEENEEDWIDDDMSIEFDNPYQAPFPDRSQARFSHEPLEVDIIDDPSCIEMGDCWKEDIWSGLPYVRIRKEMGIVASGVMIDDQRVMMISVSPFIVVPGKELTR